MNIVQSTSGHCPDDLLALSVGVQHIVFRLHDSGIGNLNGARTSFIRWKVSEGPEWGIAELRMKRRTVQKQLTLHARLSLTLVESACRVR